MAGGQWVAATDNIQHRRSAAHATASARTFFDTEEDAVHKTVALLVEGLLEIKLSHNGRHACWRKDGPGTGNGLVRDGVFRQERLVSVLFIVPKLEVE